MMRGFRSEDCLGSVNNVGVLYMVSGLVVIRAATRMDRIGSGCSNSNPKSFGIEYVVPIPIPKFLDRIGSEYSELSDIRNFFGFFGIGITLESSEFQTKT